MNRPSRTAVHAITETLRSEPVEIVLKRIFGHHNNLFGASTGLLFLQYISGQGIQTIDNLLLVT
jgi:hypothetical protein